MMKYLSLLLNRGGEQGRKVSGPANVSGSYSSVVWKNSNIVKGVEYAVRRTSLGQRIELVKRARDLVLQNEFLRAGETPEQMGAALADLYVQRLYLEWGFVEMRGFTIDGQMPTISLLIEKGPEALCNEITEAIQREISLSEDERKNS